MPRPFKKTANCICEGSWKLKSERWVVLDRAKPPAKSQLKCLECGWKWSSTRAYVVNLKDWTERTRTGMTDADILHRINEGTLRVDPDDPKPETLLRGEWRKISVVERFSRGGEGGGGVCYRFISVCFDGMKKKISVHRLVWMFVHRSIVPDGFHVDHVHGPRLGDHIDNLQLLEESHNIAKANGVDEYVEF